MAYTVLTYCNILGDCRGLNSFLGSIIGGGGVGVGVILFIYNFFFGGGGVGRWGDSGACPGIRKRGGPKSESLFFFFFFFQFFRGGGPAQKLAEKMTFSTKKVAKYRRNSLIFALMTLFFFGFSISRGGGGGRAAPGIVLGYAAVKIYRE